MEINKNTLAYFEGSVEKSHTFEFFIEKATIAKSDSDETSEMIIEGVASTTNVDHDQERMSDSALKGMANIINEKSVPLRVEHQKGDDAIIGQVFQASIDERGKLMIKAKLVKDNATAKMLYDGLKSGAKLGLSVGGRVVRATRELAEGLGKYVKTFYDVMLDEVSVTPRPANFDAWLFNKSIAGPHEDTAKFYDMPVYDRFLFENPQLDYLFAIEKSIPIKEWVKVDNAENKFEMKKNVIVKDMVTEEDVKSTSTEKEGEATDETLNGQAVGEKTEELEQAAKEATDEETSEATEPIASKSYVDKMFKSFKDEVITLLKEIRKDMTSDTTEAEQTEANGTQDSEKISTKTKKEGEAADETTDGQVTETKTEEMNPAAKAASETEDTKVEAEKADSDGLESSTTVEEGAEKTDSDVKDYGEDYKMEAMKSVVDAAIKKGLNPVDVLVAYVSQFTNDVKSNFAKEGKRVIGIESMIADMVRNNVEIQKSIKEWMSTPGSKKSVALGAPYMVTKEGQRFRLVAEDAQVEKSQSNAGKDFKSVYNGSMSSTATGEGIR